MSKRVLFVDDEPNVLDGYRRGLRKKFTMHMATGGDQAFELIAKHGPYAVVVADMRMPGMDGVELLSAVKRTCPDSVRMMLTGNSDQQTAIDAVNKGDIFRFLNKPCPAETLAAAVTAALRQHELIIAEKMLLQNTLSGSIRVLTEVLSLANPEAFGRTTRLVRHVREMTMRLGIPKMWWLDPLVYLSQIGCVNLPGEILTKLCAGEDLTHRESELFEKHPERGAKLLVRIPRMEEISKSIRYQEKNYDGTGAPSDSVKGAQIPLGARILKIALDFDRYLTAGSSRAEAVANLMRRAERYDPDFLAALVNSIDAGEPEKIQPIAVKRLVDGMIFGADVKSISGGLVVCRGQEVTPSVRERLENFLHNGTIAEPVHIVSVREVVHEQELPAADAGR